VYTQIEERGKICTNVKITKAKIQTTNVIVRLTDRGIFVRA